MARITITLTLEEKAALASYAREQRRDPRDQAALELQQALQRAGYLASIDGRATIDNGGGLEQAHNLNSPEVMER